MLPSRTLGNYVTSRMKYMDMNIFIYIYIYIYICIRRRPRRCCRAGCRRPTSSPPGPSRPSWSPPLRMFLFLITYVIYYLIFPLVTSSPPGPSRPSWSPPLRLFLQLYVYVSLYSLYVFLSE